MKKHDWIPFFTVFLSLILGIVVIAMLGKNPFLPIKHTTPGTRG